MRIRKEKPLKIKRLLFLILLGTFLLESCSCSSLLQHRTSRLSEKEQKLLSRNFDPSGRQIELKRLPYIAKETPLITEVKFYQILNFILIPTKIPGSGTKLLILDTGAPVLFLTYSASKDVETTFLPGIEEIKTFRGILGQKDNWTMSLPSIKIGKATLQEIPGIIYKKRKRVYLFKTIPIFEFQGILGLNVLIPFNVTIDFPKKKILLYRPDNQDFYKVEKSAFLKVPFLTWPGKMSVCVPVYIGNKGPFSFGVDTGYSPHDLYLDKNLGQFLKLPEGVHTLKNFRIGKFKIKEVQAEVAGKDSPDSQAFGGLIGPSVFKKYKVSFDFRKGIMYLN